MTKLSISVTRLLYRLALALLTSCIATQAHARIEPAGTLPGEQVARCVDSNSHRYVTCPDVLVFTQDGQYVIERAFNERNFTKLDQLYQQWCTGKDRFADGRWKLSVHRPSIANVFHIWGKWDEHLAAVKAWQKAMPDSFTAQVAEATYWHAYAWKARGSGYRNEVSKEAFDVYRVRLERALAIMTTLPDTLYQSCPDPYVLRLKIGIDLGQSDSELRKIFLEGVTRFPQNHNIYFEMARHYEPKWGGSEIAFENFAKESAERTRSFEGQGLYARIYWMADSKSSLPFNQAGGNAPRWVDLKQSYIDLLKQYPTSIHNKLKFLDIVCRSNDGDLYRKLRSELVDYVHLGDFVDSLDACDSRHKWSATNQ